ncbi:MAG: flagellar biosynthesis anti-sigma factor FlgM [Ruminococcus sp.]|nr:flagellar biosynthesis anti-sigma factor FlgM [Ruminococcus sp.]
MNTAKMSATALRALMGESFNWDKYEEGRKDARAFFIDYPEKRTEKIEEIKKVLEYGEYRNRPEPSYWIGCLCESDFTF